MKIIGLELTVGMEGYIPIQAVVVPLDIVFPWPYSQPYPPIASAALRTSRGDFRADFHLRQSLQSFAGTVSTEELNKHFETMRAQIERIHV